ncbi:hypothetical protein Pmar_PMAR000853 [Perkinsus marinus ATCC 50983]|uniref:Opine dehydrogenase domain-containing protein n=1 Tax=Perkinsus marinus (strain ATCC 50983 / TXsc) TaxID=423536 RepID=C5KXT6_PERM5|nr:hypothetical protein Pmar_PMAR000853 [Perkinsus marinus ATCC 50983]EER10810.1 hypothetical protein Pmar_PMAR000853 [Perkinsus marinus ATCC 50983]|eukprot:XP_002779015.1 hypothetical protein Pmar_PMAR000853 [Perkinsus marinus ATCC 50983]
MQRASIIAEHVSPAPPHSKVLTIVGGGNSGHVCASLVHGNTKGRVRVQLLTTKPEAWISSPVVRFPDGCKDYLGALAVAARDRHGFLVPASQEGLVDKVSSEPSEVLPNADIILWTGPVNATKEAFEMMQPFINTERTVVGTIFAQGLVHVLAHRVFGPGIKFFALRNIPWLCRTINVGRECEIVGPKSSIECAVINLSSQWVQGNIQPLFAVQSEGKSAATCWRHVPVGCSQPSIHVIEDFCPIVFNPANQIIHPATYWGIFRKWAPGKNLKGESRPRAWLYRDMDELSGHVLEAMDEELQAIKSAFFQATGTRLGQVTRCQTGTPSGRESCLKILRLRDRLLVQYGDQIKDKSTLAKMVGTNQAYSMARTPGVAPNPKHRVVVDDIGWGLCVLVSIAERLGVATTVMKMMIEWHQRIMGKEFLVNNRLCGRDCAELVRDSMRRRPTGARVNGALGTLSSH